MKPYGVAAVLAVVACAILAALWIRSREDFDIAQAQIASLRAANADLTKRVAEMEKAHIDDALLNRLQSDQREAIKLRAEVAKLKKSAAEAGAAAAAQKLAETKANASPYQSNPAPDSSANPYARVVGGKLNATVNVGHALVLGGWQSAPGKTTFAMAIPKVVPGTRDQIQIETKWLDVPEEQMAKFNNALLGTHSTLDPESLAVLLKAAADTVGVDLLSPPVISVSSGHPASVAVTETLSTPNGPLEVGPVMDLTPTLAVDGATVDLAVNAKLTVLKQTPEPEQ